MRFLSLCASMLLLTGLAFGQGANGTITGTITDPSGAIIANAPVEVRNTANGQIASVATSATGNYTIPQLPVGSYDMTVAVAGFKTYNRQGLDLAAAQTMRIDVALEVGSNTESVTVTADASLLKTENSALAQNVTVSQMNNLPILSVGGAGSAASSGFRDPFALAQMMPGTNYGSNGTMVINGTPNNNIQVRVDGQVSGNLGSLRQYTAQQQPSVDAIQEVAVQTSNYAAEFGTVGGGIFNASMKSGTNKYGGTAYDYSTNEAINAHAPYTGLRSAQHRYDYGFTFGGPVRIPKLYNGTNKTFFFFSFEQFREKLNVATTNATVPTQQYRSGDFSQVLTGYGQNGIPVPVQTTPAGCATAACRVNYVDPLGVTNFSGQLFNPLTTQSVVCNPAVTSSCTPGVSYQTRSPFVNNQIPLTMFDPASLRVLNLVPLPKGPNAASGQLGANYQNSWISSRVSNLPSIKIDQTVGSKGRLSGYYQSTGTTSQYSYPNGNAEGLPEPITQARGTFIYAKVIRANYDYTLTPTTLIHVGAGWNSLVFDDAAPVINYNPLASLGLQGATVNRNFPVIATTGAANAITAGTGGMTTLGPASQGPSFERRPSGSVNATSVKGNHTFKAGAEWRLEKYPIRSFTNTAGNYNFGPNWTQQTSFQGLTPSGVGTGFNFASFVLGGLSGVTLAQPTGASTSKHQWGLFVQDTWKVTRKFTLDYGLRWDYGTYAAEQYGRSANFSPTAANPSAGGHPGALVYQSQCKCNFADNYPFAIGPRLGFAYQIDQKTVLRGGFGLVYTATSIATGSNANSATAGTPGYGQIVGLFQDGIPASVNPVWPNTDPAPGQFPGTVVTAPGFVDPNIARPAKQYQWSIGLQRELNRNLVVEASYVANRGVWWPTNGLNSLNTLSMQDLARFGFTDLTSASESALLTTQIGKLNAGQLSTLRNRGIVLPYAGFPTDQTVRQSILPYPQYNGQLNSNAPLGKTWYDALQVNVTQRFSHGLSLNGNYTYAKNLDLMDSADIFNRNTGKNLSANDVPHQLRVTAQYQVPNFRKSQYKMLANKWVSSVISGWGVGWFLQYQSAAVIARPSSTANLPISNFLGRGPGAATLKTGADGKPMSPWAVNWTDYDGKVHAEPIDINCHCFDPTKTVVLNKDAWQNVPNGQFTSSQSDLRYYRGIRQPQENLNLSRNFRLGEKVSLNVRAEFQNVTNRTRYPQPASGANGGSAAYTGSPATFTSGPNAGLYSQGFGTIVPTGGTTGARTGTLIGRITF